MTPPLTRGIPFTGPSVRAILAGRKTQTRRIVKPQPPAEGVVLRRSGQEYGLFTEASSPGSYRVSGSVSIVREEMGDAYPPDGEWRIPYPIGTHLWVREAWRTRKMYDALPPRDVPDKPLYIMYCADGGITIDGRYRHARFMPRRFSRISLVVTGVRVERVQAITGEDAIAEGCQSLLDFRDGWFSIHSPDSWGENPWVFAYTFRREEMRA